MAHEITSTDGVFSVRQQMWHGLGTVLPEYPTREQAQEIAHPWEPVTEPLFRRVVEVSETGEPVIRFEQSETAKLNVRSDNGFELGPVSPGYVTVNNSVMYEIAEAIRGGDTDAVRYETGGSLEGGRRVWLLLKLAEPIEIKGDPNGAVIPYFALQNAHNGSASFRGQATFTRIVCANTAHMADMDSTQRGTQFTFSHTKNVKDRIEEARKALAGWRESITAYQDMSEHLVTVDFTREQQDAFLERFIPMPALGTCTDRVANNVETARAAVLGFLESPTNEGIKGTAWGMVQASIEYLNWGRRAHQMESRFKRTYLDKSDLTNTAVSLVKDLAGLGV